MVKVVNDDLADFRYERKYVISHSSLSEIEAHIGLHPAMFTEIYHQRYVNNIYFDTIGYKNYFDNVDGISSRKKFRIRWYGDLMGEISTPKLEIKIKHGALGEKESFSLMPFMFNTKLNIQTIQSVFDQSEIPESLCFQLSILKPILVNRYSRRYYQSRDKKIRVTVDTDVEYDRFDPHYNYFVQYPKKHWNIVLEMKYPAKEEIHVKDLSVYLPFRFDKNSKYVNGVELIYM